MIDNRPLLSGNAFHNKCLSSLGLDAESEYAHMFLHRWILQGPGLLYTISSASMRSPSVEDPPRAIEQSHHLAPWCLTQGYISLTFGEIHPDHSLGGEVQ